MPYFSRRAFVMGGIASLMAADATAKDKKDRRKRSKKGKPKEQTVYQPGHDVVLVYLDDMRDSDWAALPQTRRWAEESGRLFPNFVVNSPSCSPSRASVLTGIQPHKSGVRVNKGAGGGYDAFRANKLEDKTIFRALPEGYRGGFFGKFINGYGDSRWVMPGADRWWVTSELAYEDFPVNVDGNLRTEPGYYTTAQEQRVRSFLQKTEQPVFAYVSARAPHGPSTFLERDRDAFKDARIERTPAFNEEDLSDKPWSSPRLGPRELDELEQQNRKRLRSLLPVDRMIAGIRQDLEARGNPFTVLVASDNGWLMGDHRLLHKGQPYRAATVCAMAAIGPGFVPGVDDRMASTVDLTATVAARVGAAMPWASGVDLATDTPIDAALIQIAGSWEGFRTRTELYVERGNQREYYDLQSDPWENENLFAGAQPRVGGAQADELHARLEALK